MILNFIASLTLASTPLGPEPTQPTQVDFIQPITIVTRAEPRGVLSVLIDRPLGPTAQPVFDNDFSKQTYFSAFATSLDGGYGFAVGASSLGAARDMAMQQCVTQNGKCAIVAQIVPQGYVPPVPGEVILKPEIAEYFYNPGPEVNGMRAMAISEDGAWAFIWGYATQAEADADALATCEENRSAQLPTEQDWPCFLIPGAGQ